MSVHVKVYIDQPTQLAFTCLKSIIETLDKGVKYI